MLDEGFTITTITIGLSVCPIKCVILLSALFFIDVKILFKKTHCFMTKHIEPNENYVPKIQKTTKSSITIRFLSSYKKWQQFNKNHTKNNVRSFARTYKKWQKINKNHLPNFSDMLRNNDRICFFSISFAISYQNHVRSFSYF